MADNAHLRTSASTSKLLVDKGNKISASPEPPKRDLTKRNSWNQSQEPSAATRAPEPEKAKEKPKDKAEEKPEPAKDEDWASNMRK